MLSHRNLGTIAGWLVVAWGVSAGLLDECMAEPPSSSVLAYDKSDSFRWRLGVRVSTERGAIQQATISFAVPMEWPEQSVTVIGSEGFDEGRFELRRPGTSAEEMLLRLPYLRAGSSMMLSSEYEITRWTQRLKPEVRDRLGPAPSAGTRQYLRPSDGIESGHPEIRRLAAELVENRTDPLERATVLFAATRERLRYVQGPFAGALAGLRAGQGDCEEYSCLLIALCRAAGLPARLVWGPGHCWCEVAFSDPDGKLVWIPADATKQREFGVINHFCPILQKGDNFRVPELAGQSVRYLSPRCTGLGPAPMLESLEQLEPIDHASRP